MSDIKPVSNNDISKKLEFNKKRFQKTALASASGGFIGAAVGTSVVTPIVNGGLEDSFVKSVVDDIMDGIIKKETNKEKIKDYLTKKKIALNEGFESTKESLKTFFDFDTNTLKEISSQDSNTKITYDSIKNILHKMRQKEAIKTGLITALAVGVIVFVGQTIKEKSGKDDE